MFPSGRTLGVEVTSTYSSNSAAKLLQIPSYAQEISADPSTIHKKDVGQLEVLQGVTLSREGQTITTNLVMEKVPAMPELLQRLGELIAGKEAKLREYRRRCSVVDLIIADAQGQFHWRSPIQFAVWLRNFLPKDRILRGGFREIYINTVALDVGPVSAALKGSLFYNDCVAYLELIREQKLSDRYFFGCLSLDGYGDASVVRFGGHNFARYGPWIFDGSVVQDIRQDLRDEAGPRLEQVFSSSDAEDRAKMRELVDRRKDLFVKCGVLLAETDGTAQ